MYLIISVSHHMYQRVYIQIGTNDGNDQFREKVIHDCPDLVILVEPNSTLIPIIHENYKNVKTKIIILNNAVYYESGKIIELYVPAINGQIGTKADNGCTYSHVNFSIIPMNDWGDKKDMAKIKADTITWNDICDKYEIRKIEYLQIDTEGFDSEIIRMIDFDKYEIQCLRFEKWFFDSDCYNKYHNSISEKLGKNGMLQTIERLISYGYIFDEIQDADGNDFIARRNV